MEEIRLQVGRARRRLTWQRFWELAPWAFFAAFVAAALAAAVPKLWVLQGVGDGWRWGLAWLGGAAGVGLVASLAWTWFSRRSALEAAIELDRRFGLKERVSSALALAPDEQASEAGRALLSDAARRVGRVNVAEQFRVRPSWRVVLPLLPAAAAIAVLAFAPDATLPKAAANQDAAQAAAREQIKKASEALQRRLAEKQKQLEAEGLEDAEAMFRELQQGLDQLQSQEQIERKDALVKLNDLQKELQDRRRQLGGSEEMRKQMEQLEDIERGPADRVAQAIKQGDFNKAVEGLRDLQQKVEDGELSDEERQQLAQQLDQLQEKLDQLAQAHEEAKQDLERRIEEKQRQGDLAGAGELQQQLDQLASKDQGMQQMQQMAQKLGDCSKCLSQGNQQGASEALDGLADQLAEMQQELDQLETLDEAMQEIADARQAMGCKECQGQGCAACQGQGSQFDQLGQGQGQGQGQGNGDGLGEGQGQGDRPEEQTDTSFYESQVRGQPRPGEAVRVGDADGPNVAGRSVAEAREELQAEMSRDPDPIVQQRLPRSEREQTRQYFEQLQGEEE